MINLELYSFFYPFLAFIEKHVGTETAGFKREVIAIEHGVGVTLVVERVIGWLAEATAKVNDRMIKTLIGGAIRVAVTEMPFTKNCGGVTGAFHNFGKSYFFGFHDRASKPGIGNPGAVGRASSHQAGARRRTNSIDVKALEEHAF